MAWLPADPRGRKQAAILMLALVGAGWYVAKMYALDPRLAEVSLSGTVLETLQNQNAAAKEIIIEVDNLHARIELQELQSAVDRFRAENARYPASLEELRQRGYIRVPPRDLQDREYSYDPRTGRVSSTAGRVLGES